MEKKRIKKKIKKNLNQKRPVDGQQGRIVVPDMRDAVKHTSEDHV